MRRESHHSAGIILFRDTPERTFLLLRSALTRRPVWEFPKGAIEPGETVQQAAERELQEEAGLTDGDYQVLDGFVDVERYYFTRGTGADQILIRKQVTYFVARWKHGEIRLSPEATRFQWATAATAERRLRFPEKRRVLANAIRWLEEHHPAPTAPLVEPPLLGG
ncbi:MAG TPA: NUDIX domain-containing protein [Longimicrobiaceae bacterium]